MYTAFYGLREKPFALVPDPRYLFLSEAHREALAHLLYGIDQGEGFIAVTGEVGTGKTTICRTLLERLGSETEVAFLFNPSRSGIELLQDISAEFGLDARRKNRSELGAQLNRFLLAKKTDRRRVLLIIDEAQNLSEDTLEQVRLLSNLETSSSKLIQILLLGQPELDTKLDSSALRQLRQRISVRWQLGPLSARETRAYVKHRLYVAAGTERTIFTDAALREIHRRTGGVPRLVNVLCDRSLLAGFVAKAPTIGPRIVKRAASEIPDAAGRSFLRTRRRALRPARRLPAVGLGAAIGLLGAAAVAAGFIALGALPEPQLLSYRGAKPAGPAVGGSDASEDAASVARPAAAPGPFAIEPPEVASPPPDTGAPAIVVSIDDDVTFAVPLDRRGAIPVEALPEVAAAAANALRAEPEVDDVAAGALAPGDFLALALDDESRAVSRRGAVDAILRAFGLSQTSGPMQSDSAALDQLRAHGLAVLPIPWATLPSLRALNHPALLRVTGAETEPRLVALTQLEGERAWLYGVTGSQPLRVPISELSATWTREAWVVWNEFEDIKPELAFGHHGDSVSWLQSALAELGYYDGDTSGLFDGSTRDGVRALQVGRSIPADGIAGPRTRMVLYDMLGRYDVPRLVSRPDTAEDAG